MTDPKIIPFTAYKDLSLARDYAALIALRSEVAKLENALAFQSQKLKKARKSHARRASQK
jgi:hypothetical protein